MRRIFVQIFKHFDGDFAIFLHQIMEKPVRNFEKNMQLLVSIQISIPEKSTNIFTITIRNKKGQKDKTQFSPFGNTVGKNSKTGLSPKIKVLAWRVFYVWNFDSNQMTTLVLQKSIPQELDYLSWHESKV